MLTLVKLRTAGEDRVYMEFEPKEIKFSKSLTDQSFYTPNSEMNKTLGSSGAGGSSSGAYDTDMVSDVSKINEDLVKLRRPGNDIVEVTETVKKLDEKFKADVQNAQDKAVKDAQDQAVKDHKLSAQSNFIDNLMSSSSDNTKKD